MNTMNIVLQYPRNLGPYWMGRGLVYFHSMLYLIRTMFNLFWIQAMIVREHACMLLYCN